MTIDERLADIEKLALRHFPTQFEVAKRLAFRLEKVEQLCREYEFRERSLSRLEVRDDMR